MPTAGPQRTSVRTCGWPRAKVSKPPQPTQKLAASGFFLPLISRITEDQQHLSMPAKRGKGTDKLPEAISSTLTESIPNRAEGTRPGGRSQAKIPPFSPLVVPFYSHRLGASAPSSRVAATYFRPRLGIMARPPPPRHGGVPGSEPQRLARRAPPPPPSPGSSVPAPPQPEATRGPGER